MESSEHLIAAQRAVEREREANAEWRRALIARDRAVRALYLASPSAGPSEIGAAIGLNPSTVRGITRDLAAERRDV